MSILRPEEEAAQKRSASIAFRKEEILDRIVPLLSTFVPAAVFAAKGLSLVSPRIEVNS